MSSNRTGHEAFIREIHRSINFADDKFQRSRFSEFKRIFGMLHGAVLSGGIPYDLYTELYREVWDCKFAVDTGDMEDPEQAKMDFYKEDEDDFDFSADLSAFEVEMDQ